MTGGRKLVLAVTALGLVAAASTPAVAADSHALVEGSPISCVIAQQSI